LIAVADINTLWRRKPFEALSLQIPVLGLMPQDVVAAWRNKDAKPAPETAGKLTTLPLTLPTGWASRLAGIVAPYLGWKIRQQARRSGEKIQGLVVTSPHYLELVKRTASHMRTFYYCSDDYAQYANWGGTAILQKEAELARRVDHCFFVSRPLADRAVSDYGLEEGRVSVSPNATDSTFFQRSTDEQRAALHRAFPALRHPWVGVVGAINSRLDFDLIEACSSLPSVGSVVMVGPVDPTCQDEGLRRLRQNPKCVFVGPRPHGELPAWMQALDVALIPYRDTPLNRACSPMRLFDHLAAGKPVVGTAVNAQVASFEPLISIGHTTREVCERVESVLNRPSEDFSPAQIAAAKLETWDHRATRMLQTMGASLSNGR
jgi:glycosyltransferase involved in cell wall biosynthesis